MANLRFTLPTETLAGSGITSPFGSRSEGVMRRNSRRRQTIILPSALLLLWVVSPMPARAHDIPNGSGCHPTVGDGNDHGHVYVTRGTANETDGTVTFHVICAPCAVSHASTH